MRKNFHLETNKYIAPNQVRSITEITVTLIFLLLSECFLWYFMENAHWILFALLIVPLGLLYSRLFILQHDLGHGNLFKKKKHNDAIGVIIGIFLLTPYHFWKKAHTIHHVSGGNVDRRPWVGDIDLLSVREYKEKKTWQKLFYRLYRAPFVMFFVGSIYVFMVDHRFVRKQKGFGRKEALSVIQTNIAALILYGTILFFVGIKFYLLGIFLPQWLGGVFGIALFYIQHNFKDRYFVHASEWTLEDSALKGSTFYDFPQPLKWFTGNIGYHHIHTYLPRIPFYYLPQCHRENAFFHQAPQFGLKDIPTAIRLKLFDEETHEMITWKEYKELK